MLKSLHTPTQTHIPNQTRLMAEYMLNSYKKRIEQSLENEADNQPQEKPQQSQSHEFMSDRLIRLLKKKIKEKSAAIDLLQAELSSAEHIIKAEEHLRKKFETENHKLKQEKQILAISRDEETTMLTLALNKYRDEKNKYCTQLQKASKQITSLEFELKDKKNNLQKVAHDLLRAKKRLTQEATVRHNRDKLINSLETEKKSLLHARAEETIAVHSLYKTHARAIETQKEANSRLRQKIHFLEIEEKYKNKEIANLKKERKSTEHARNEESEALLYFLEKYRTMQKKQQASILDMKKEMYQEGLRLGSIVQDY